MFEESNIEDVEQIENSEAVYYGIGDADTAEGQARRAEEAHFEEMRGDSDTDESPTLGEMTRIEDPDDDTDKGGVLGNIVSEFSSLRMKEATEEEVRRAISEVEEDIEAEFEELAEQVEDLPPLPTAEEAKLGELCRTPRRGQFDQCELVDDDSGDLIEVLEGGDKDEA